MVIHENYKQRLFMKSYFAVIRITLSLCPTMDSL